MYVTLIIFSDSDILIINPTTHDEISSWITFCLRIVSYTHC